MNVKLHVEIGGDHLDVEGDQQFVEQIYDDFRQRAGSHDGVGTLSVDVNEVAPLVALTHREPGITRQELRNIIKFRT